MDDPVIRKKYGNNDRPDFKFLFTCSRSRRLAGVRILFLICKGAFNNCMDKIRLVGW